MKDQKTSIPRRWTIGVIGSASGLSAEVLMMTETLGRSAAQVGLRIITGGMGGVMEAVCRGAHQCPDYQEGTTIGVLPSYQRQEANPYTDVVIATGAQLMRNVIVVASADCVIAIGGGAGTLSEIALAWQLNKPILALAPSGGWAAQLADQQLDHRHERVVESFDDPDELIARAIQLCAQHHDLYEGINQKKAEESQ